MKTLNDGTNHPPHPDVEAVDAEMDSSDRAQLLTGRNEPRVSKFNTTRAMQITAGIVAVVAVAGLVDLLSFANKQSMQIDTMQVSFESTQSADATLTMQGKLGSNSALHTMEVVSSSCGLQFNENGLPGNWVDLAAIRSTPASIQVNQDGSDLSFEVQSTQFTSLRRLLYNAIQDRPLGVSARCNVEFNVLMYHAFAVPGTLELTATVLAPTSELANVAFSSTGRWAGNTFLSSSSSTDVDRSASSEGVVSRARSLLQSDDTFDTQQFASSILGLFAPMGHNSASIDKTIQNPIFDVLPLKSLVVQVPALTVAATTLGDKQRGGRFVLSSTAFELQLAQPTLHLTSQIRLRCTDSFTAGASALTDLSHCGVPHQSELTAFYQGLLVNRLHLAVDTVGHNFVTQLTGAHHSFQSDVSDETAVAEKLNTRLATIQARSTRLPAVQSSRALQDSDWYDKTYNKMKCLTLDFDEVYSLYMCRFGAVPGYFRVHLLNDEEVLVAATTRNTWEEAGTGGAELRTYFSVKLSDHVVKANGTIFEGSHRADSSIVYSFEGVEHLRASAEMDWELSEARDLQRIELQGNVTDSRESFAEKDLHFAVGLDVRDNMFRAVGSADSVSFHAAGDYGHSARAKWWATCRDSAVFHDHARVGSASWTLRVDETRSTNVTVKVVDANDNQVFFTDTHLIWSDVALFGRDMHLKLLTNTSMSAVEGSGSNSTSANATSSETSAFNLATSVDYTNGAFAVDISNHGPAYNSTNTTVTHANATGESFRFHGHGRYNQGPATWLLALDDASIYLEDVKYGSIDTVVDLDFTEQGSHAAHFEVRDGSDFMVLHKNSSARWFHPDQYTSSSWRDNGFFELNSLSEVNQPPRGNQSTNQSDTGGPKEQRRITTTELDSSAVCDASTTTLDLSFQNLTELPDLSACMNMLVLNLEGNLLTSLPRVIFNMSKLIELNARDNKLRVLSTHINRLDHLESLYLEHNNLTALPEQVGGLASVLEIHVDWNHLTSLPESMSNLRTLQLLSVTSNDITSLPWELGSLHEMLFLYLSDNRLSWLPYEFSYMTKIREFDISGNMFGYGNVPWWVYQLPELEILHYDGEPTRKCDITTTSFDLSYSGYYSFTLPNFEECTNLVDLNLGGNYIQDLPDELFRLSKLTTLRLQSNRLQHLPIEIEALSELTTLVLSNNYLQDLPDEIGGMLKLQYLEANNNQLTTLPHGVGTLTSLTALYLTGNQIAALPVEIGSLSSLADFNMEQNYLAALPSSIGSLTSMRKLVLNNNRLVTLPFEISGMTNLETLGLEGNRLTAVTPGIGALTKIIDLNIAYNSLKSFPPEIGNLVNMRVFHAHANQITTLPEEFGNLASLQYLQLSYNRLTSLPRSFGRLNSLQTLELGSNNMVTLPASFAYGNLSSLAVMNVWGAGLVYLPDGFGLLPALREIRMSDNRLDRLPADFGYLSNLRYLDLQFNRLVSLPDSFGSLAQLSALFLSFNPIAALPVTIGGLISVNQMYASNMRLSTVPASIGNMTSLQFLYISNNPLPTLPAELFQLPQLRRLDISSCGMTSLPDGMAGAPSLTYLFANTNLLTDLPADFVNMVGLQSLELSQNNFGAFPAVLANMTNLQYLSLGYNKIATMPLSFVNMRSLFSLDLSYNLLRTLPAEMAQLGGVRFLYLDSNRFTEFPTAICSISNLVSTSLNYNQIDSLPDVIGQCKIQWLSLSSNHITSIPKTIGNMTNLRTLYLSSNRLTSVPTEIIYIPDLNYLDVSNNQIAVMPNVILNKPGLWVNYYGNPANPYPCWYYYNGCGENNDDDGGELAVRDYLDAAVDFFGAFLAVDWNLRAALDYGNQRFDGQLTERARDGQVDLQVRSLGDFILTDTEWSATSYGTTLSVDGALVGTTSGFARVSQYAFNNSDVVDVMLNGFVNDAEASEVFAMNSTATLRLNVLEGRECEVVGFIESTLAEGTARIAFDEQSYTVSASGSDESGASGVFKRHFEVPGYVPSLCFHPFVSNAPSAAPTSDPTTAPSTVMPTLEPTGAPTLNPTFEPTYEPTTSVPTIEPTLAPTAAPTMEPSKSPSWETDPTAAPTILPSLAPSGPPTFSPTKDPTAEPTLSPSSVPTESPTKAPSANPTAKPTLSPSETPTRDPTATPTRVPTREPTYKPSLAPVITPTVAPSRDPTFKPSSAPISTPSIGPTKVPTLEPSSAPVTEPTFRPSSPSASPSVKPTAVPSIRNTAAPSTPAPTLNNDAPVISTMILSSERTTVAVSVAFGASSVFAGSVTCAAVGVNASVTSTQQVLTAASAKSSSYLAGATSATVYLTGLSAVTQYSVYCAVVTINGVSSGLTVVQDTRRVAETACCKTVSFTNAPSSVYGVSSKYTSAQTSQFVFTYALSAAPVQSVTVVLALKYANGSDAYSHDITASPSSLTFGASSSNLVGRFVLSSSIATTLRYSVALVPTGAGAAHYLGESVDVTVLSSAAPKPVPTMTSAKFANSGGSLAVTFDSATSRGSISAASFACSALFTFAGDAASTCSWVSSSSVRVLLPSTSSLVVGSTVTLKANLIKAECTGSTCNTYSAQSAQSVSITAPDVPLIPTVLLSTPAVVSSCDDVTIDPSLSAGSGGRAWQSAVWTVTRADALGIVAVPAVLSALSAVGVNVNTQIVLSRTLFVPSTYTVTLTLTNFMGGSASATTIFALDANPNLPIVTILGGAERSVLPSDTFNMYTTTTQASCAEKTAITYKWTVSKDDAASDVTSYSANPSKFSLLSHSLVPGSIYTFVFEATARATDNTAAITGRATAKVRVLNGAVVVVVVGGYNRQVATVGQLVIDASPSYDENVRSTINTGLTFTWSCTFATASRYGESCGLESVLSAVSTNTLSLDSTLLDAANQYAFQVVAKAADGRAASAVVSVQPQAGSSTYTSITSLTTKVNADSKVLVGGVVRAGYGLDCVWTASVDGVEVPFNALTSPRETFTRVAVRNNFAYSLLVPSYTFSAGSMVTFRLKANEAKTARFPASSEINIQVNAPPTGGYLLTSPASGTALSTLFAVSSTGWIDDAEDFPLTYQFLYQTQTSQPTLNLQSRSPSNKAVANLPAGLSSTANAVYLTCNVFDASLAVSTVTGTVTVTESVALDVTQYVSDQLSNFDSLGDVNTVGQLIANVGSTINKVNCTLASDSFCASKNRGSCSSTPQTCSSCLDGYTGAPGDSNAMCVSNARRQLQSAVVGSACSSDSDCLFGKCSSGLCVAPPKLCPSDTADVCSGHGTCKYSTRSGKALGAVCTVADGECHAQCECTDGYGGLTCGLSAAKVASQDNVRAALCNAVITVGNNSDPSVQLLESLIGYLDAAFDPKEVVTAESMAVCQGAMHFVGDLVLTNEDLVKEMGQPVIDLLLKVASKFIINRPSASKAEGEYVHELVGTLNEAILSSMVNGQAPYSYATQNMRTVVSKAKIGEITSLAPPLTAEETFYGGASRPTSYIEVVNTSTSSQFANSEGYVSLVVTLWGSNPFPGASSVESGLLRVENHNFNNARTLAAASDAEERRQLAEAEETDYYVVVQLNEKHAFNYSHSISEATALGLTNFTFPECTNFDGSEYTTCDGCTVSTYTDHNVTFACSAASASAARRRLSDSGASVDQFGATFRTPSGVPGGSSSDSDSDNLALTIGLAVGIPCFFLLMIGLLYFYMSADRASDTKVVPVSNNNEVSLA